MSSRSVVKSAKKNEVLQAKITPQSSPPALREVNVPVSQPEQQSQNVIAVYKDLNQPARDFAKMQQRHLLIGICVFTVLALGIMMGQKYSKTPPVQTPRAVASAAKGSPAPGTEVVSEHYHYDKSCYLGENGEQVCTTTTSQKKR